MLRVLVAFVCIDYITGVIAGARGIIKKIPLPIISSKRVMLVKKSLECPVPLVEDLIPLGRSNRPGGVMATKYVTIHDTGNPSTGANARAHASYLKGDDAAKAPVSWHFTVDDQGAVQHLPLNEHGWHAGDGHGPGNMTSMAIEICENVDGDRSKAEANAAKLVAWLLVTFGLDAANVVPHKHWGDKQCPHILLGRWDQWLEEISSIKGSYDRLNKWNPEAELVLMARDGLVDSEHPHAEKVTWGEFATVINRLRHVRPR